MRVSSFGISGIARSSPLNQHRLPAEPPHRVHNWLRRRLEDSVEDVFHAALQRGDLATAEDLLRVMENIHTRAKVRFKTDRKGSLAMLDRVRRELAARKARRLPGPP